MLENKYIELVRKDQDFGSAQYRITAEEEEDWGECTLLCCDDYFYVSVTSRGGRPNSGNPKSLVEEQARFSCDSFRKVDLLDWLERKVLGIVSTELLYELYVIIHCYYNQEDSSPSYERIESYTVVEVTDSRVILHDAFGQEVTVMVPEVVRLHPQEKSRLLGYIETNQLVRIEKRGEPTGLTVFGESGSVVIVKLDRQ